MFVGQSSFILEGRKVALAERRRLINVIVRFNVCKYYESKFA